MKHPLTISKSLWLICVGFTLVSIISCRKEGLSETSKQNPSDSSLATLKSKGVSLSAHSKSFYEYLPEGYASDPANTKYPLLIFFHGGGEIGNDSSEIYKVLRHGPLKHASNGSFPKSFSVNGKTYRFIILAPQFTSSENSFPDEVDNIIEYAKRNYRVDASRIYLTGMSFGGGLCWNYVGKNANYAKKIAAIVPIAAYINEARPEFKIDNAKASSIATTNLPLWSAHNGGDDMCPLSWVNNAYNLLKASNASLTPSPKLSVFNVSFHEGWTTAYDPSFKENNLSIYEWMLQYHR